MSQSGGTPRARALAGALRVTREAAKVSQREVARRLGLSNSTVSDWEAGKKVPAVEDVASYLAALGVTGDQRARILDLSRHADDQDWLAVGIPGISQQLAGTMECERAAVRITDWMPTLIPGLLQTSDYARAIISTGGLSEMEINAQVLIRMGRRDVITRSDPVEFVAVLGEAALREPIGGPRVMAAQLRHLLKTVKESETITIQVVRQGLGVVHPGLAGPFVIYDFEAAPSIVLLEHHRTGAFVYEQDDVAAFTAAAGEIRRVAMSPDDSIGLIAEITQQLERTT